ncbi:MAG TPA: 2-amino-4-hydroxy-6-hydroxymethyldihydropteridine diphosphokinase [Steroidobacteraceae bacterium]|nr:2-amino-4-hydroxy-6-hydroxymethyldihydropteridine diphosphokinase [Steroidobacteraceae bacterium]
MTAVLVAAGSNVAPIENLRRALDVLEPHFAPLQVSRAYANPAVGFEGDDFVNLVVRFDTELPVHEVLQRLHDAERACGRPRDAPRWAPRSMDLDILLFGDDVRKEPGLTLPRPDLLRRPYMLGPAAEVAADTLHPTERRTLGELWREMQQRAPAHELRPVDLGWVPNLSRRRERSPRRGG